MFGYINRSPVDTESTATSNRSFTQCCVGVQIQTRR